MQTQTIATKLHNWKWKNLWSWSNHRDWFIRNLTSTSNEFANLLLIVLLCFWSWRKFWKNIKSRVKAWLVEFKYLKRIFNPKFEKCRNFKHIVNIWEHFETLFLDTNSNPIAYFIQKFLHNEKSKKLRLALHFRPNRRHASNLMLINFVYSLTLKFFIVGKTKNKTQYLTSIAETCWTNWSKSYHLIKLCFSLRLGFKTERKKQLITQRKVKFIDRIDLSSWLKCIEKVIKFTNKR